MLQNFEYIIEVVTSMTQGNTLPSTLYCPQTGYKKERRNYILLQKVSAQKEAKESKSIIIEQEQLSDTNLKSREFKNVGAQILAIRRNTTD